MDAGGPADAALPDAAVAPWPDRPTGQCVRGADCATGLCNAAAPGGFCQGCGDCPGGYTCNFGTCNRDCDDDADCPYGLECNRGGSCVVIRCDADADCPGPYVCNQGLCNRPTCGDGCPAPLRCVADRCVEPE
ncbi:MAG: hypothetical protein H6704_10980 [Myxococcales bacterium]|nr:hypothetical protein [Myxococcales bacterium]